MIAFVVGGCTMNAVHDRPIVDVRPSYDKYELEDIATLLKMIPIIDSLPPP